MPLKLKETNISNEHRLKNPNWREADQLAIYKHDRGVELGSTEKQLQLSGQSRTWTRDLRISSRRPNYSATLPPQLHANGLMTGQSLFVISDWSFFVSFDGSIIAEVETIHINLAACRAGTSQDFGDEKPPMAPMQE